MADDKSLADELLKLHELKEKGVITQAEFDEQKAVLLERSREQSTVESSITEHDGIGTESSDGKPNIVMKKYKPPGSNRMLGSLGEIEAVAFVVVVLLAIGGYFWFSSHQSENGGGNDHSSQVAGIADCPAGSKATGRDFRVRGNDSIPIRIGPGKNYDRVLNPKATEASGKTEYAEIDSSTQVFEECRQGDWSRIRLTEPEWLRESHHGWVINRFLVSKEEFSRTGFTEEDFIFYEDTQPYKSIIIRAVNKIAKEDSRCTNVHPIAFLAPSKRKRRKPIFFVTCGDVYDAVNIYFSEDDLTNGKKFTAPKHIDRTLAVGLCEEYAKRVASHPSTVDFSTFWDLHVFDYLNGETTVMSTFKAKNGFGLELKFNIRCRFNAEGLIKANVAEQG